MTAEDPVEYNLEGINQVKINEEIGLTFAAALRSFLRQDPNIIMVGEIRDIETASIAVKAALTGHLVFSTLHTNDAPSDADPSGRHGNGAVPRRLLDEPDHGPAAHPARLLEVQGADRRCTPRCSGAAARSRRKRRTSFYRGRGATTATTPATGAAQGVYEVMPITPTIRNLILDRAPTSEIRSLAIQEGMLTLRAHALMKLKSGITTAEEILKETTQDD